MKNLVRTIATPAFFWKFMIPTDITIGLAEQQAFKLLICNYVFFDILIQSRYDNVHFFLSVEDRTTKASVPLRLALKLQIIIVVTSAPASSFFMLFYVTVLSCIEAILTVDNAVALN